MALKNTKNLKDVILPFVKKLQKKAVNFSAPISIL